MTSYTTTRTATGLQKASMGYAKNHRVWAVVTAPTFEKVKQIALTKDTSISNVVRLAIQHYLRNRGVKLT